METEHEVIITENAKAAQYYAANQIPYVVWLNERNRTSIFQVALTVLRG